MPSLWVFAGPTWGAHHEVGEEVTFGRSASCEVVLHDRRVSRRHARIVAEGGGFALLDLGSRNGTLWNGTRIEGRVALRPGDRIQIGQTRFVFEPPPLWTVAEGSGELLRVSTPTDLGPLERAALGWSSAGSAAGVRRLGLAAALRELRGDHGLALRISRTGELTALARQGTGIVALPAPCLARLREGDPSGSPWALVAPAGDGGEALAIFRARGGPAGGFRSEELGLFAAISSLCGAGEALARRLAPEAPALPPCFDDAPAASWSPAHRLTLRLAEAAALHRGALLLLGEAATGRTALAGLIHRLGGEADRPFEVALPGQALGQGGWRRRVARAEGGTLFLAEVSRLVDLPALAASLAELEWPEDPRLPIPMRLVASSRLGLGELVEEGRLPVALAERLLGTVLEVPPLRARGSDLGQLAGRLLTEFALRVGRPAPQLSAEAIQVLEGHGWPGNLAELRGVLLALSLSGEALRVGDAEVGRLIEPYELPAALRSAAALAGTPAPGSLGELVAAVERAAIASALRASKFKKLHAARALKISRPTLDKKIARYGIRSRR